MSATTTRGDVYLDFLYRFKCIGKGQLAYLLNVPEFRKRISEFTGKGMYVNECTLVDILNGLLDDVASGVISADNVPIAKVRNMINRLNREIEAKSLATKS